MEEVDSVDGAIIQRQRKQAAPTAQLDSERAAAKKRQQLASRQYGRGDAVKTKNIKDKKLRGNLRALEERYKDAALKAKDAEILLENSSDFLSLRASWSALTKSGRTRSKQALALRVQRKALS